MSRLTVCWKPSNERHLDPAHPARPVLATSAHKVADVAWGPQLTLGYLGTWVKQCEENREQALHIREAGGQADPNRPHWPKLSSLMASPLLA